jgi:hypothetical protein
MSSPCFFFLGCGMAGEKNDRISSCEKCEKGTRSVIHYGFVLELLG